MPHLNIKHFPVALEPARQAELIESLTAAIKTAFGCPEGVISIALEPVEKDAWGAVVYDPEIRGRSGLLRKRPEY